MLLVLDTILCSWRNKYIHLVAVAPNYVIWCSDAELERLKVKLEVETKLAIRISYVAKSA